MITPLDQATFADNKHSVVLGNGQRLAYVALGDQGAPPVVLIHGFSDNARSWSLMAPTLMDRFRLILPDLRGHGRSAAPECCYTNADLAHDVTLLLDHLGVDRAAVVGHSLGSHVALTLAARWPDRCRALVLESCKVRLATRGGWLWDNVQALVDPIDPGSPFMMAWYGNPGPVDGVFVDLMRHEAAAMPARVWRAVLYDRLGFDATPLLADVTTPTLILHGAKDPLMTAADQVDLRAGLTHAAFRSYPDFGHNPHWEDPAGLAQTIADFARG